MPLRSFIKAFLRCIICMIRHVWQDSSHPSRVRAKLRRKERHWSWIRSSQEADVTQNFADARWVLMLVKVDTIYKVTYYDEQKKVLLFCSIQTRYFDTWQTKLVREYIRNDVRLLLVFIPLKVYMGMIVWKEPNVTCGRSNVSSSNKHCGMRSLWGTPR